MRYLATAAIVMLALPACAVTSSTLRGFVYDDVNGDGIPNKGEAGVANAVVAFGPNVLTTTNSAGHFEFPIGDGAQGIAWVRVPDGFTPGPVWARVDLSKTDAIDLGLHRLDTPILGPITFVVAADTHITYPEKYLTGGDLQTAARLATALDPAPAFFAIVGDITQGNRSQEFEAVNGALEGLGVPFVPVPGNHDWYDGGQAWFFHWGPDNYSFDIGNTHFLVWNMAMKEDEIRLYLGAELSFVAPEMTVVALTHAPPSEGVTNVLRELGVDYVLTGHAHSNRVFDHGGVIELNTEPMLMGGLDFTPGGYRVLTLDGGQLESYHRATVEPLIAITSPGPDACVPETGGKLVVSAALDGSATRVVAEVDCGEPTTLRDAGGWTFDVDLPTLEPGPHRVHVAATSATGTRLTSEVQFQVCAPPSAPPVGEDWPQLGGGPAHLGARAHEIAPPLTTRWVVSVGGHVLTAPPVIAAGTVYVATSDLGPGNTGGVVALDLATGAERWRVTTDATIRGGLAVVGETVIAPLIDGVVLALDTTSGMERWRYELSTGIAAQAGAVFAAPVVHQDELIIGHQRRLAAIDVNDGTLRWSDDPVPVGRDSQSAAAVAVADGLAVGTFERALGGVVAWDEVTGARRWRVLNGSTVAINASPVMDADSIYLVSGAVEVTALDRAGVARWRTRLDDAGFDWGHATIGTPALAAGILVVPTLYRDLVALDAATGVELWRLAGNAAPLRMTHYRGGGEAGFAASPVISGGVVWAVDTSGQLSAIELTSGLLLWQTELGSPVLAGLAPSGDWLIAASFDGTVRALVPMTEMQVLGEAPICRESPVSAGGGCCNSGRPQTSGLASALVVLVALGRRRRVGRRLQIR